MKLRGNHRSQFRGNFKNRKKMCLVITSVKGIPSLRYCWVPWRFSNEINSEVPIFIHFSGPQNGLFKSQVTIVRESKQKVSKLILFL